MGEFHPLLEKSLQRRVKLTTAGEDVNPTLVESPEAATVSIVRLPRVPVGAPVSVPRGSGDSHVAPSPVLDYFGYSAEPAREHDGLSFR